MSSTLVYSDALAHYRFPAGHPMVPERFTLAVDLMQAWGLLDERDRDTRGIAPLGHHSHVREGGIPLAHHPHVAAPAPLRANVVEAGRPASIETLELAHTRDYIECVRRVSAGEPSCGALHGIGAGDTPAFPGMHEAAALAVTATCAAVDLVVDNAATRTFSPAGGLHHAHADYASGFCVYNDVACAIEYLTRSRPGISVAYVDIDAHHGDGVEAAFAERPDVLTVSVHESGRYLFPGTGREADIGIGEGTGFALNLPLPPYAGPECYAMVLERAIVPAVTEFGPDLLVLQLGADSHAGDPLTHLSQTVSGYFDMVAGLLDLADELTGGSAAMTGGGGYQPYSEVPRMWAGALALALDRPVPDELPPEWLQAAEEAALAAEMPAPEIRRTCEEDGPLRSDEQVENAVQATDWMLQRVAGVSPLLS